MKIFTYLHRIILCTILGIGLGLNAQTVSHDFKNTINDVFAGVDLTKVPHHLLLDYAMEFVDIRSYNGVANDTNYVHKGIYTSGYNTLLMARTQTNVADLVDPDQLEIDWQKERKPYTIALSGLYYKYSRLRENAYPDDITISNNKLYDKYDNGVWQDPYETDDVFMMTAPILRYNYKNMLVKLPASLWRTNQDTQVQSIAVDFNDGNGYQTLTMGQSITLSYANEGTYDWDYKLTLNGGQVLYSHSKLIVGNQNAPLTSAKRLITEPCDPTNPDGLFFDQIEFQGTQQFQGTANSATIQIDYSGTNNFCDTIDRPLIVAEGFESGLLGTENPLGENNLNRFRNEIRGPSIPLRNEIDDYDIIYVNWDQGRDDLRRNALLLEDIIEWVNDTKTDPNVQNVVLGQSMGGVIARYALADMEDNPSLDHDTSLYISHDAPHQGANIPIGIQYFARHLEDQFVSTPVGDIDLPAAGGGSVTISDIQNVFNSPGTRQLLSNNINGNFSLDNSAFDSFQTELQSLGYPTQTRNIAISNGSHCANTQIVGPQQELLYLSGDIEPTILLDAIINYFPLLSFLENAGYVALAIILDDPAYLAGLLPGRTNLNARFQAKTLPSAGQSKNIYKGRIRITKKIDFLIATLTYNINITDRERNNPSTVQLPLDSYPGGAFNVTFDLEDLEEDSENNFLFSLNLTGRSADSFNFIPTPTALDVGSGITTLINPDYTRKYNAEDPPTGSLAIPFDNFTTSFNNQGANERHISFNTRNGDWLALELNDINNDEDNFNCTFICNGSRISGSNQLCQNTSQTYTVSRWPTDANFNWDVSPSGGFTTTTTANSITLTPTGNFSGEATLTVTASNACGTATSSKTIQTGAHRPIYYDEFGNEQGSFTFCMLNYDGLAFETPPGVVEWEWTNNNSFYMTASDNGAQFYSASPAFGVVSVRVRDNCGWSAPTFLVINLTDCSGGGGFGTFRMSQNPVSDGNLKIEEHQNNDSGTTNERHTNMNKTQDNLSNLQNVVFEIYDFTGYLVETQTRPYDSINHDYDLNVSQYADGHYFLKVIYGDIVETFRVIIN